MYVALVMVIGLAALVLAREAWLHIWLAGLAQGLQARGHREAAVKLFERVVRSASLFGSACAPNERFRLSWCYLEGGRPLDAAAECRAILAQRRPPAIEANVRRRLADALEAAGEHEAAGEERARAEKCLEAGPRDAEHFLARARELADRRQYPQACEHYRKGLELIPTWNDIARAETMVRLSLASFHAGQLPDAADWAEKALALNPAPSLRMTAHSAAAVGYSSQGRLEEAERHHQAAYETAIAADAKQNAARYLASLGGNQRRRGRLLECVQSCQQATELSRSAWRLAALSEAEAFKSMGRFDQARDALARAQRSEPLTIPAEERRSLGTLALGFALLESEAGQPDVAASRLLEARAGLAGDERLAVWCDTVHAWILAQQGKPAESAAVLAQAEARLASFASDHATWEIYAVMRARALTASGDYGTALGAWEAYLGGKIDPVDQPTALHHIGECYERLGDPNRARDAYRRACDLGIDSHDARLARRRLEALDDAAAPADQGWKPDAGLKST